MPRCQCSRSCQHVASCDLAVASSTAKFATPGVNIGLFCSTPMVALTRNVARKAAMEMLLTGDMMSAQDALRIGVVNRGVAPEAVRAEAGALAHKIAAKSMHAVKIGKEAFYRQFEMDLTRAYDYAADVMVENTMARDAEEGIAAFVESVIRTGRMLSKPAAIIGISAPGLSKLRSTGLSPRIIFRSQPSWAAGERPQAEHTMMRTLIAAAFILTGLFLLSPSSARAYTQAEQQACQDDAYRLCGDAIPDERRVRACLVAKMRHLSPACRRVFRGGRRR